MPPSAPALLRMDLCVWLKGCDRLQPSNQACSDPLVNQLEALGAWILLESFSKEYEREMHRPASCSLRPKATEDEAWLREQDAAEAASAERSGNASSSQAAEGSPGVIFDRSLVRCIQRGLESVKLEVSQGKLAPPWCVQSLVRGAWFQNESWSDLAEGTDCRTQDIEGGTYHITIWCLKPETCYTFRILPKVEEKGDKSLLSCECETLGKAVCEAPRCMRRLTDGLELHWCVKTPSQAPVLECQLQYCTADFLSLWQDVPSVEIKVLDIKRAKESSDFREEIWQGIASKLKIATAYRFRVKSRNSVGWSEVSDPETCLTSEAPRAPNHLKLVTRSPGKVEVDFQFMDEEGCPVSHIEPEFCLKPESSGAGVLPGENGEGISNMFDPATWWWQTPGYFEVHVKDAEDISKAGSRSGSITVGNLKPEQRIWLRLIAVNQAGRSIPSAALPCRSSERPAQVSDLRCTMRGATWLDLQWRTCDPEGAPVKECCVEVSRANFIHSWVQVPPLQIQRIKEAGGSNLWQVKVLDLEREADYHVRVKASNEVGWSVLEPLQINCRTAERPHKPRHLSCADLGTNFVKIEFKVASNFGQEEHISKVQVEESGMLLWTEIPASRLEIEELAGTEVDGQTDAEMHDLDDLGPFWNAELRFKSFTVVIRGLEANSSYTWRIAVANEVGWSCEKSEPFQSHTIYRPAAPKLMEAQRGAFELRVFWDQPDPLGGPINAWEAQVCESSVFSTWSAAKDFVLLRQPQQNPAEGQETQETADSPAFIVWEATFGCLKAGMEHQLRLRTGNVAGWSEWSEPLKSSTCGPPIISKCTVMQVPSSRDTGDWIVDIFLKDNPCRAFLCAVDFECDFCSGDSKSRVRYQTVARHEKYGNWRAHFPRLANLGLHNAQRANASVVACNAAGWSKVSTVSYQNESKEEQLTWAPKVLQAQLAPDASRVVPEMLWCLKRFLSTEGELLRDLQQEMSSLLSSARFEGRMSQLQLEHLEHKEKLLFMSMEAIGSLQNLTSGADEEPSWRQRCVERLKQKETVLEKEKASKKASAAHVTMWEDFWAEGSLGTGLLYDVQLLMEGCLCLEEVRSALDQSWAHLCQCAETQEASESPPARVVRLWVQKREAWAARFEGQFVTLMKQAALTSAQLLVVTRSLPSPGHVEHLLRSALTTDVRAATQVAIARFEGAFLLQLRDFVLRDLTALKHLRVACDHQLRKLQRALELLSISQSGISSDSGGAHSFPEVSVTDKLSQTALGLILTMVMPVPGSVEVGVASIGALWLEGDSAGKHLVVEHPVPEDLNQLNPFSRFRQHARHSAQRMMASWAGALPSSPGGGQEETATLLVHNAASRIITVRILDRGRNIALRAYEKVQEAHPMVRLVSQALVRGFGAVSGNMSGTTWQAMPGVAIGPADLALLPLPAQEEGSSYEIEFAYGLLDSSERPLGRVPARTGMAVSFVHLDDEIHVDNLQKEELLVTADELPEASSQLRQAPKEAPGAKDAVSNGQAPTVSAEPEAKTAHISYLRAANKDAVDLTLRFFHLGSTLPSVSTTSGPLLQEDGSSYQEFGPIVSTTGLGHFLNTRRGAGLGPGSCSE
eukprot:symbB.v1.2.022896.t1/scaffold2015.1/size92276/9